MKVLFFNLAPINIVHTSKKKKPRYFGHCHHFLLSTWATSSRRCCFISPLTWLFAFDMVTGDDVTNVPGAELFVFLKMRVGACCPWFWPASLMLVPCITFCCCCPGCDIWFAVIADSVMVPFWTGALEKVTRLLFIVKIVEVWVLLFVGYTNLTGSFFGIFNVRCVSWGGWCWPATKFEKICWWLTLNCWLLKWLLFIVEWTLLFDSFDFVKFALFAGNEDATRKAEINKNENVLFNLS